MKLLLSLWVSADSVRSVVAALQLSSSMIWRKRVTENSPSLRQTLDHPPPPNQPTHMRPPRQRLRCVPDMFNSLEVQVLYPT
jgi:hypothetical protein